MHKGLQAPGRTRWLPRLTPRHPITPAHGRDRVAEAGLIECDGIGPRRSGHHAPRSAGVPIRLGERGSTAGRHGLPRPVVLSSAAGSVGRARKWWEGMPSHQPDTQHARAHFKRDTIWRRRPEPNADNTRRRTPPPRSLQHRPRAGPKRQPTRTLPDLFRFRLNLADWPSSHNTSV